MSGPGRYPLRLVVQRVHDANRSCYRVIAYGDRVVYKPLELASLADVRKALGPVLPEVDAGALASLKDPDHSQIVFTTDILVDETQLQRTGLKSAE